ncbi:MAG: NAD(P)/FAD-dependent oxidoreductase [Myxococcota bacterium]
MIARAVVVGAGIGGPVAALWLRRLGVDVTLAEARSGADAEGAFLGLAPNGLAVLDALGLAGAVAARGHACDAFSFLDAHGRELGRFDRRGDRDRFGWPLTLIRRSDLHEVLADAAVAAGAELQRGRRLVGLDGRHAVFDAGPALPFDVLLGCDGLRSAVRRCALPDTPAPTRSGLLDVGGFAPPGPALPFPPGVNVMVFGRRAFFGAFATPSGETWWFHNGPDDVDPDRPLRERLLALHADDPPWIRALVEGTPAPLGPWPLVALDGLRRWTTGRIALLGDAAHAMSPSAGQGASLAMEDAMVLARCLRDVADPAAALAAYERERRPRVDAIAAQARRNGDGKAPRTALGAWVRDQALKLFLPLGQRAQSAAYDHRISW